MFSNPNRIEIDHHTIKLIIGIIAISLAALTSFFSDPPPITSISASYYKDGWARNILVGFLFAISAFLLAYNGRSTWEMVLSKIAAAAAIGVAMFPCKCVTHTEIIPGVHAASAAAMFAVLAGFCYIFFKRAKAKSYTEAKYRSGIYVFCGITIVSAILVLAYDNFTGGSISAKIDRLTFYGEAAGLIAFGIAWLTASRVLPGITNREERITLSPFSRQQSQ